MTDVPPPPPAGAAPGPNPAESKNSLGVWALVLGILSIVCCGIFTGIPAVILGLNSKKAGEQGLATNGNIGNIGFILGIIGSILALIGWIVYFGVLGASFGDISTY